VYPVVNGNESQSCYSGLRNHETSVGIPNRRQGCGLEKHLRVVDAQIKIIRLRKRHDQVAERQRKADLTCFGEKHYFFENRKGNKYRINSPFHSLKRAAGSPAKSSLPASDMMDQ
jgi:hypothetical protein